MCKNEFFLICSFGEWSSSKSQKPLLHNQWSQMCLTAVGRKKLVSEEEKLAGDSCFFFFKESSVYVGISLYYMLCLCIKLKMLSYRGWRNSQWWWWQQWLRRRWAQFEPGAQSTTESISGWWQSARQHCPQTQRYNAFVDIKLTSYYICVTAVDCVYDRQTKCFSFLFLVILSNVYLPYILHRV